MYSSKSLEERNNDPVPWVEYAGETTRQPRPEYQYGKLPANPVLVEFREEWKWRLNWLALLKEWINGIHVDGYLERNSTPEQRAHAHRVITLIATLRPLT